VSLRWITRAAKTNLASVNYHFGDKETVYREVMLRRLRPLNAHRLAGLDEAAASAGPRPPPLRDIILIMARPFFDLHRSGDAGERAFARILSRSLTEPPGPARRLLAEEYNPLLAGFAQMIRRHAPQLPPAEFMWRFSFVVGAMHHTLATLDQMTALTSGICRSDDYEGALAHFVAHAEAVFPPSPTGPPV
jgi:AcrR family transcriptional regulator